MRYAALVAAICCGGAAVGFAAETAGARLPFGIEVVDDQTGRGVPLVELRTIHGLRFVTDSAGRAAIDSPELVGHKIYFHVSSHGYEHSKDGFGYRGAALDVRLGASAQIKLRRINLAERLYRMTGAGVYADSVALERHVPIERPLLNAQVFGSDSVVNAVYRGRIYWFWGDTNRPGYPLGNFHVPGATSKLPIDGGLAPDQGVNLDYFVGPQGFAKETARMDGDGPTWIGGLSVVPDADGRERLLASYVKVRQGLKIYRRGIVEFDDEKEAFVHRADLPLDAPLLPDGHPFVHGAAGVEYIYFPRPYPWTRVAAKVESYLDLNQYEAFTCLRAGDRAGAGPVERNAAGQVLWGWKRGAAPLSDALQKQLVAAGQLRADEAWLKLVDRDSSQPVVVHGGSVAWNKFRARWIMIFVQTFGTSLLGEVWYAEAEQPEGPWRSARKIVTHERYSFYNPKHHPMLDEADGRRIYFEGTYTNSFSGNSDSTPRYDYNQVLYRLDLSDPRLHAADAAVNP